MEKLSRFKLVENLKNKKTANINGFTLISVRLVINIRIKIISIRIRHITGRERTNLLLLPIIIPTPDVAKNK